MAADELSLMSRLQAGDAAAGAALYALHGARVKAFFVRSGYAADEADALTLETFERAARSAGEFDPGAGRVASWLARSAHEVLREVGAGRAGVNFEGVLADAVFVEGGGAGSKGAGLREEMDAVSACIEALPAELARAMHLRYVQGRTVRGVATAMNVSEERARATLDEAAALVGDCLLAKGVLD